MNANLEESPLDVPESAPIITVGPGQQLRETRTTANLSLNEVAAHLHLDAKTIQALESDHYDELPAPTFVRGYLRGYARLLGLPATPILEAFDQHGFAPPALVADISDEPQTHSADFPVRLVTYLVIALLVGLVVLWWHNQRFASSSDETASGNSEMTTADGSLNVSESAGGGPTAMLTTNGSDEPAESKSATEVLVTATTGEAGRAPTARCTHGAQRKAG